MRAWKELTYKSLILDGKNWLCVWDNFVGFGVLVKQRARATMGKIILRIEVQFPTSYYNSRNVLLG
jgi:hypothetical protein